MPIPRKASYESVVVFVGARAIVFSFIMCYDSYENMSHAYRHILLWVSAAALVASAVLATMPAAGRAQLTWQGSYVTTPRPSEGMRLLQGHGAAPDILSAPARDGVLWQFALGMFLVLFGCAMHAWLASPAERTVRVRTAPPRRCAVACYWYHMRV